MRILINILTASVILISFNAVAYDNEITHRRLTREAVVRPDFNDFLIKNLGLLNGVNTNVEGKEFSVWLTEGSYLEDKPDCRASNHFHNPFKPWTDSGMSDQPWYINLMCSSDNEYPPANIKSNVHWATGYTTPSNRQATNNQWDWDRAREDYYTYLTGKDASGNTVAATTKQREMHFANSLQTLGQVMHLMQDMSVPAHVRDDFKSHLDWLGIKRDSLFPPDAKKWFYERYEYYVQKHIETIINDTSGFGFSNPTFERLTDFWDTEIYNGQNPDELDLDLIGLAEYTNMNFVSRNTILSEAFLSDSDSSNDIYYQPYPRATSTDINEYINYLLLPETVKGEDDVPDTRFYISKMHDGEQIDHFLAPTYFSWELRASDYVDERVFFKTLRIDDVCARDYADILVPRAIGYSAALLDYFFRGKLEVSSMPFIWNNQIFSIRLKIKNVTSTQEVMRDGQFTVVCRYTPDGGNPDGSDDVFINSYSIDSGELEYGDDGEKEFYFYLPSDKYIPMERYDSVKCTLVFKGTLGSPDGTAKELNAVVGKAFTLGEIKFNEEWDNGLTGNHSWYHMTQSYFENAPDNGITYNEISTDNKLVKDNIRFGGQDYHQFNHSALAFEGDGIPITPDTYLQTKIDNIWITPFSTDHTQNLLLNLSINGDALQMVLCPEGHCYWHDVYASVAYTVDFSGIVFVNIYALLQSAGIEIVGPVYLTSMQISQHIVKYDNTPAATDEHQHMEVDFIRIIEQKKSQ